MSANTILAAGNSIAAGNFGSPMQLIILVVIVLLLFGGNRLRNLGGDLGGAIKGFKKAMSDGEKNEEEEELPKLVEANAKLEKVINPAVTVENASQPAATEKVAKPRARKPKAAADKEHD
jgi:sec-independent protein translocase protein TatA